MITQEKLTHLRQLEAEFTNPVMMYSVGNDSSVILHLAMKAFAPSKLPFPLLHVDTLWKLLLQVQNYISTRSNLLNSNYLTFFYE